MFPHHCDEWRAVDEGFRKRCHQDIMGGSVTAIDGFLQRCNKRTNKEVKNILSYYSGYYESYGILCQAVVKRNLQLIYFGGISPGYTNDIVPYVMSKMLKVTVDKLQLGLYVVGDAGYPLSEKLFTPYVGIQRQSNPYHDSYLITFVDSCRGSIRAFGQ